ncbi:caspase family protein [candidate division WOR-3 bacterium]|nr:caspase family protein [candidate division WOR-3 bacterium]
MQVKLIQWQSLHGKKFMSSSNSRRRAMMLAILIASFSIVLVFGLVFPKISQATQSKGIKVVIKERSGRKVVLYKGSHALLVGVSKYTSGWPILESVPGEINRVEAALKKQGFHIVKILDPTSNQLSDTFEDFINRYGFDENNRLLFFFSGHGYTRDQGRKGYLVPVDAPDPRFDDIGFVRKALGMTQILAWARQIEAKHALFVFDSCFSGTIFKTKALPKLPPHISDLTSHPVRQFISAGSAGQEVPAHSVFVPSFIRALRGDADLDSDGYVTGTELGMYLHKKILSYETGQTPQYGKIKDPDLDEGDFVFHSASLGTVIEESVRPAEIHRILKISFKPYNAIVVFDNEFMDATSPIELRGIKKGLHRIVVKSNDTVNDPFKGKIPLYKNVVQDVYIDDNEKKHITISLQKWKLSKKKRVLKKDGYYKTKKDTIPPKYGTRKIKKSGPVKVDNLGRAYRDIWYEEEKYLVEEGKEIEKKEWVPPEYREIWEEGHYENN